MTNGDTKMLLRMARTFDQADNILSKTWCKTEYDKAEYLRQLFPRELGDVRCTGDIHDNYQTLAMAVIHSEDNEPYMWGYRDGFTRGAEEGYEDAAKHILKDWDVLRKLSDEGIREHYKRILHRDVLEEVWDGNV